jgi:hypothetical protein
MTGGIDAKVTLNVTVHDPRALRRAAWERAKEGGTTAWEHADFRRRAGGIEADLLTLLDDRMSPPGASIEDSSAELFRLESVL